jgi:hypothetical protein
MRILVAFATLALGACQQAPNGTAVDDTSTTLAIVNSTDTAANDDVAACTERGVAYFREIGSYPTLSSAPNRGRLARDVAAERCGRTLTAF